MTTTSPVSVQGGPQAEAVRLTPREQHFLHGYYSVQPWNHNSTLFACHRVPFMDRMPGPRDLAEVGVIDPTTGAFEVVGRSTAWNYQVGTMLQWVEGAGDTLIYNVFEDDEYQAVVHDLRTGAERRLDRPIAFQATRNGRLAFGHTFARLAGRRDGYAYAAHSDDRRGEWAPSDDGVFRVDLASGEVRLIVSFAEMADRFGAVGMPGRALIIGRFVISWSDDRLGFSFRFADTNGTWQTSIATCELDGSDLFQIVPFGARPKHWDWFDNEHILAWTTQPGSGEGFHLIQDRTGRRRPIATGILGEDGHVTIDQPGGNILVDTFPDADQCQWLYLMERHPPNLHTFGPFASPPQGSIDLRCDLHPCWNRGRTGFTFDSIHEGFRACYAIELDSSWHDPVREAVEGGT